MIGTIVNFSTIILGSLIGLLLKKGIKENVSNTLMHGLALCVLFIGITSTLKVNNVMLVIISVVIGAIIGELIDINKALENLGNKIEALLKNTGIKIAEGFVTASLVYCIGSMAIVGSLESGLQGNNNTLFAKAVLDGVSSVIFASTLGIGVALSAFSVLIYQGSITLLASLLKGVLIQSVITDMTVIGGLLIIGLALNILKVTKIKIANLLPAIFIPIVYQIILNLFHL